jgi:hypothetical protein
MQPFSRSNAQLENTRHQYKDALSFLPHPSNCSQHEGHEVVELFKFGHGFAPVIFEIFAVQQFAVQHG